MSRILGGVRAGPVALRFLGGVFWRWLFHRTRYPLLLLDPRKGGFLRTLRLLYRMRMTKIISAGGGYHFSLVEPRWPSRAYDLMMANGGLNVAAAGTTRKAHIDLAILGIARRCPYRCPHCCERHALAAEETVPIDRWHSVVAQLQDVGVSVIALSGGEPMMRYGDILRILRGANQDRSDFHLYTTGFGVTRQRVTALAKSGLVAAAVGLDDYDASHHDAFRRAPGAFDAALAALRLFRDAGLLTCVNTCITPRLKVRDHLHRFYEFVTREGADAIQLLEPMPCGGHASAGPDDLCSPTDRETVAAFFWETTRRPFKRSAAVYYPGVMEAPEHLGCLMGGLSHLHVDAIGRVKPCPFLPVSFGNALEEGFRPVFERMRAAVAQPIRTGCLASRASGAAQFVATTSLFHPVPLEER